MGLKIYVAGKWQDRFEVRTIQTILRDAGHEITCDWTDHEYPTENVNEMLRHYATADIQGVKDADVVICVFIQKHHYRGALVEMGAALALDKPVFVLGHAEDSCIFMQHPNIRCFGYLTLLMEALPNPTLEVGKE